MEWRRRCMPRLIQTLGAEAPETDVFASRDAPLLRKCRRHWHRGDSAWHRHWGLKEWGPMYWHGSLDNTRCTVEKIIADRAKGILVITGIESTPCPLEGLKSTLDSITLNRMSFGPEDELFIDAKGVSTPSPGQAWGTKAFLVDGAQTQPTGNEAFIRRVGAVPMKVMFEPKEGTDQPIDGIDVLSHAEIDDVVNYMRMGMHDRVAAKKRRAMVTSPHWWDDKMLVTGKYKKDESVARVMDHIADQYDGPVEWDPPTWDFPRMGADSDSNQPDAAIFRRLSVGDAPHDDEDGISDEEKSDSDREEAYTAVRSVVLIPKQAAEEAQENPKVAGLKERLINAYPRLFSGVANKNPPDRGRFGTAKIKLKPNPKIYRHREYQLQGDRAEAMKKLLAEFIERGWIEPSDSEWASPAFIVPEKEKGEWRLVVDYRGLNEQTEHDSYSLPLIDSILQKQQKKRIFTVLDLKHGYHQMPLHPDSRPCTAMSTPLGPMQWRVVPMGAKSGNAVLQRMMEDLLGPVRDCADPFVDDIIIGSGTEEAKRIIEMEKAMEREGVKCFVVMANRTDLAKFRGARVQAFREETLEQWMVAPVELVRSVLTEDWSDDYAASEHLSKYWNAVSAPSDDDWPEGLTEDGDRLFLKDKLLVPENRVEELIDHWHNAQLMLPGRDKMQQDLEWRFKFPPGYYAILDRYCSDCAVCRATKSPNHSTAGNPVYTAIPEARMRSVAMDVFAMPQVTVEGETYDCVILAVDRHSGYIVAVLGKKSKKKDKKDKHGAGLQAKTVANAMIRHWLTIFDVPAVICSDRGSQFVVTWFKTMCKHMGIRHAKTVAYHSWSNGRAEVAGRQMFEKFCQLHIDEPGRNWYNSLWRVLQAYHDLPGPTGLSPHRILFLRDRVSHTLPWLNHGKVARDGNAMMAEADDTAAKVCKALQDEHDKRAKYFKQGKVQKYALQDTVWVEQHHKDVLSRHRQASWYVPGVIVRKVGQDVYAVRVGDNKILDGDHTQLCLRAPDPSGRPVTFEFTAGDVDSDDEGEDDDFTAEKILADKPDPGTPGGRLYKVRWKGFAASRDSWEPPSSFVPRYTTVWMDYLKKKNISLDVKDVLVHLVAAVAP